MTNAVMFTAIPTGIASANAATGVTVARLSVYVTPQIADTSLATVPAFADWPKTVSGLTFSVQLRGTSPNDPHVEGNPVAQLTEDRHHECGCPIVGAHDPMRLLPLHQPSDGRRIVLRQLHDQR